MHTAPRSWLLPSLLVAMLLAFLLDILSGPYPIKLSEAFFSGASRGSVDALVLFEIRLPRSLLAALVGACLGLAGAVIQGLLRNPGGGAGIFYCGS